ncbi:hypothetical protein F5Y15DRAFT_419905 [Xylariaceae sp. FL0016]|nr:hypothetical protein F5Y15DRAFT_419905 [Xylariaceae sp. FL0016]
MPLAQPDLVDIILGLTISLPSLIISILTWIEARQARLHYQLNAASSATHTGDGTNSNEPHTALCRPRAVYLAQSPSPTYATLLSQRYHARPSLCSPEDESDLDCARDVEQAHRGHQTFNTTSSSKDGSV